MLGARPAIWPTRLRLLNMGADVTTKRPKQPAVKERDIVLAILQYLQPQYHTRYCIVRVEPVTAMRMALKARGTMHGGAWKDAPWSDGVADILMVGPERYAFEVKSRTGRQRLSQMEFERRWTRAGGRYHIVRSVEDVMEVMK
jgi:hypothetical protein